jgi:hypothetical protein
MKTTHLFAATAALTALAAPAAAQTGYPQAYQQPYQQAYPQGYGQPGYGQPGYAYPGQGSNVVGDIIGQLLGNRYTVTDRTAVTQCASAALAQASAQYGGYGQNYPGQRYQGQGYQGQSYQGYQGQGYNQSYNQARVTAITEVKRSSGSLRVKGLIATGQNYRGGYGGAYSNQGYGADPRYAQAADLSFRCNVDYRGAVTNVRLSRNNGAIGNYRR